jgi:hypothetical protein
MNGLELTDVCTGCGAVLWIGQAHSCPRRAPAPETKIGSSRYLTSRRAMDIPTEPRDRTSTMTLAAEAPARTDDAPALDGLRVSHMAATLLRKGYTSESVRDHAAGRQQFAYMWLAIADSMDATTADKTWAGGDLCWSCRMDCPSGCSCLCHNNGTAAVPAQRAAPGIPRTGSVCPLTGGSVSNCPHYPGCQT